MPRWIFFVAGFVVAGCSTEGRVTPLSGGVALPQAKVWALDVQGCGQVTQCEDIRSSLVGRLIGTGLAERVVSNGQPYDVRLDVGIERLRSVSGVERVVFGTFAGRNEVMATDRLTDRNGGTLRTFKVESASAAHPFSGESGLSDAYRQFATDTVSALR